MSHLGIPSEQCDYLQYCEEQLPETDPCEVYGLNWNIQSNLQVKEIFGLFTSISQWDLHKGASTKSKAVRTASSLSVSAGAARACLQASPAASLEIHEMLMDQDSLLSLMAALQSLLSASSLDPAITHGGARYDHQTDPEILALRDTNDQEVSKLAAKLLQLLDAKFSYDTILEKFPIKYKAPLNNIVHKELDSYRILLHEIRNSVADLIATADGQNSEPLSTEGLWYDIQHNRVPSSWRKVSFSTARTSLVEFLVELTMKLDFWNMVVAQDSLNDVCSYWLPAFFSPQSFLNSLAQSRARNEEIPLDELLRQYEV